MSGYSYEPTMEPTGHPEITPDHSMIRKPSTTLQHGGEAQEGKRVVDRDGDNDVSIQSGSDMVALAGLVQCGPSHAGAMSCLNATMLEPIGRLRKIWLTRC